MMSKTRTKLPCSRHHRCRPEPAPPVMMLVVALLKTVNRYLPMGNRPPALHAERERCASGYCVMSGRSSTFVAVAERAVGAGACVARNWQARASIGLTPSLKVSENWPNGRRAPFWIPAGEVPHLRRRDIEARAAEFVGAQIDDRSAWSQVGRAGIIELRGCLRCRSGGRAESPRSIVLEFLRA